MQGAAADAADAAVGGLFRGQRVEVFYRRSQDPGGYFPVHFQLAGALRPRIGVTDGWIQATVHENWPPSPPETTDGQTPRVCFPPLNPTPFSTDNDPRALGPAVFVQHTHEYWVNHFGEALDPSSDSDMIVRVPRRDVRILLPSPRPHPSLSLLIVRWGANHTLYNEEQWGSASASVSERYISTFLDGTIYDCLGPDYEVISAFICASADLDALRPSSVIPLMHGRHRAACYFLWPTSAQDGSNDQSGMVHHASLLRAMRLMESAGLPTRFPHPSSLYSSLLSKDWLG